MKHFIAIVVALVGLGGGIVSVQAQQVATACATPGTARLAEIPADRDQLVPSQGRLIAGYGRAAKVAGCKISLVCISTDRSDPARELARQKCVVVRDTLVRGGFIKGDISTARETPSASKAAGMVYLTAL